MNTIGKAIVLTLLLMIPAWADSGLVLDIPWPVEKEPVDPCATPNTGDGDPVTRASRWISEMIDEGWRMYEGLHEACDQKDVLGFGFLGVDYNVYMEQVRFPKIEEVWDLVFPLKWIYADKAPGGLSGGAVFGPLDPNVSVVQGSAFLTTEWGEQIPAQSSLIEDLNTLPDSVETPFGPVFYEWGLDRFSSTYGRYFLLEAEVTIGQLFVPEPGTITLLGLPAMLLCRRRRSALR